MKRATFSIVATAMLAVALLVGTGAAEATFKGANGKIAFYSAQSIAPGDPSAEDFEIFTIDPDGTDLTQLTVNGPEVFLGHDAQPAFSPDGEKIAFMSDRDHSGRDGNYNIYRMLSDGSNQVRLTKNLAADLAPAWSPGGTRIAFQSDRSLNWEIYTMKAQPEGRKNRPVNLTKNAASIDIQPNWSPNGKKIAYSGLEGSNRDIFTKPVDGGARTNITDDARIDSSPDFSPNGKWIVYQSNGEVRVSSATGNDFFTVVEEGFTPAFSPDGSQIVYSHYDETTDTQALFTVTFTVNDGVPSTGTPTEVPGTEGARDPNWQPTGS
jgi:Tol biopolymer transport system component